MRVAIILLSWNSKQMLGDCLRGLLKWESSPVYVVDNSSEDGSPEYIVENFPTVHLIRSPINLGFAAGNNLGIKKALQDGCDGVFLLNNDTIIDKPFLQPCVEVLQKDPSVGIVGPVIVEGESPDVIQCRGGVISPWRLSFPYLGAGEKYVYSDNYSQVGYVLGAAMLIRKEVIEKTDGLDPEYYPAYVEEADLCYRAGLLGYKSVVTHSARVRHLGAKSSGGEATSFRRFTSNRFLFALKHLGAVKFLVVGLTIVGKVFLKKIIGRMP